MSITKSKMGKLLILVAALALLVGAYIYWQVSQSSEVTNNFQVSRTSGGGISGRGDGANFVLYLDEEHFRYELIQEAKTKIKESGFFDLKPEYMLPNCADGVITELQITLEGKSKSIRFENCGQSDLPEKLLLLDGYLRKLEFEGYLELM